MTVVPMRDSTTDGLMFVRPIPQGSAPPAPGAFWTDEYGWLVPNTRLQDIINAPRCEHGKIDRHRTNPRGWTWIDSNGIPETERCAGAPELMALLDALNEEDNDE